MKRFAIIILALFSLLAGCQNTEEEVPYPLSLIDSSNFEINAFDIPKEWDITGIIYQLGDEDYDSKNIKMLQIFFGKASKVNKFDMDKIKKLEKENFRGIKTVYRVTSDKEFAALHILKMNQPMTIDEYMETTRYPKKAITTVEVGDKRVKKALARNTSTGSYFWVSNDHTKVYWLDFIGSDLESDKLSDEQVIQYLEKLVVEK